MSLPTEPYGGPLLNFGLYLQPTTLGFTDQHERGLGFRADANNVVVLPQHLTKASGKIGGEQNSALCPRALKQKSNVSKKWEAK